jgi:hypothetical protein
MTPHDFYNHIQTIDQSTIITLSPGPFAIKVNQHDAMAAKLLLWLEDQMPEDATIHDLTETLNAAQWWSTFWSSLVRQPKEQQEPPQ